MRTSPKFSGLYRTLGLSVVMPLIAIQVLLRLGVTPLITLAVAALFPLAETVYEAVTVKRTGLIAIVSLVGLVVGFGLSFATGNAIFALLKDSLLTGVFGLLFLGSLLTSRPLIYRLNLDLAGNDPAARAGAEALWQQPAAQHAFRLITIVWGVGLLLDAGARVAAAVTLPIARATSISPVIAVVCIGSILVWTLRYVRARRAAAAGAAISG